MALEGRTILVTRARGQNVELRRSLEKLGANVVEVPTIAIAEPDDWQPVDKAIGALERYDWIVFTSVNAVEAFCQRGLPKTLPQVAVVGRQTARRAEALGIDVALVPEDFRSAGLLDALPTDMTGVRLLLPRADIAGEELPASLRSRGAEVDTVTIYRTQAPSDGAARLAEVLSATDLACVTFTSGSTVRNFVMMLGAGNPSTALARTAIAVIGPVTRQTAEDLGLDVTIQPPEATIPALVEAIRQHFSS